MRRMNKIEKEGKKRMRLKRLEKKRPKRPRKRRQERYLLLRSLLLESHLLDPSHSWSQPWAQGKLRDSQLEEWLGWPMNTRHQLSHLPMNRKRSHQLLKLLLQIRMMMTWKKKSLKMTIMKMISMTSQNLKHKQLSLLPQLRAKEIASTESWLKEQLNLVVAQQYSLLKKNLQRKSIHGSKAQTQLSAPIRNKAESKSLRSRWWDQVLAIGGLSSQLPIVRFQWWALERAIKGLLSNLRMREYL
jgi:hypothetical protein